MKNLVFSLLAGLIIVSCTTPPVEKQFFTDSPDIDLGKKVVEAYLAGDWQTSLGFYVDTARIWRNKNWTKDKGLTIQAYIKDQKWSLESVTDYDFETQLWISVITDNNEHFVYFWGVWSGHSSATDKDYEMPVHFVMEVVNNKIIRQGEFYNNAELALDMMVLAKLEDDDDKSVDD